MLALQEELDKKEKDLLLTVQRERGNTASECHRAASDERRLQMFDQGPP